MLYRVSIDGKSTNLNSYDKNCVWKHSSKVNIQIWEYKKKTPEEIVGAY